MSALLMGFKFSVTIKKWAYYNGRMSPKSLVYRYGNDQEV